MRINSMPRPANKALARAVGGSVGTSCMVRCAFFPERRPSPRTLLHPKSPPSPRTPRRRAFGFTLPQSHAHKQIRNVTFDCPYPHTKFQSLSS